MSDVQHAIEKLNNATNHIAAELTRIRAILTRGEPATQGELEQLDVLAARLEGLAVDPSNPVP